MKSFIKNIIVFVVLLILLIEGSSIVRMHIPFLLKFYPGNEIYFAIIKSKIKNNAKKLLLGDSVGHQLFPNKVKNDKVNSLTCNQSISVAGQYFLLNNYLNAGNKIDTVYLLFSPFSFQNNLDQVYTYHYFLKPFDRPEYTALFTPTLKKQIEKIPFRMLNKIPHVYATAWAPKYTTSDKQNFTFISPISKEYLQKIHELAIKNNFKLIILPTPTNLKRKVLVDKFDLTELENCNFKSDFDNFFYNIIYLDSTYFVDGIHLINPEIYTELLKKKFIR